MVYYYCKGDVTHHEKNNLVYFIPQPYFDAEYRSITSHIGRF